MSDEPAWTNSQTGEKTRMTRPENSEGLRAIVDAWSDADYRPQLERLQNDGLSFALVFAMAEDALLAARKYEAWRAKDQPRRDEIAELARGFVLAAQNVHKRHGYDGPMADARIELAVEQAVKAAEGVRPEPMKSGD